MNTTTRSLKIPQPILDKMEELNQLIELYPNYIPLPQCASFLGMDADGLRRAIELNQCSFGISWQRPGAANRAFKIPTLTFTAWYTKGFGLMLN